MEDRGDAADIVVIVVVIKELYLGCDPLIESEDFMFDGDMKFDFLVGSRSPIADGSCTVTFPVDCVLVKLLPMVDFEVVTTCRFGIVIPSIEAPMLLIFFLLREEWEASPNDRVGSAFPDVTCPPTKSGERMRLLFFLLSHDAFLELLLPAIDFLFIVILGDSLRVGILRSWVSLVVVLILGRGGLKPLALKELCPLSRA